VLKFALEQSEQVLVPSVDGARHAPVQAVLRRRFAVLPTVYPLVRVMVAVWPRMPVRAVRKRPRDVHHAQPLGILANALRLPDRGDLVTVERVHVGIFGQLRVCQGLRLAGARAARVPCPAFVVLGGICSEDC
jgi:hypothetical protein